MSIWIAIILITLCAICWDIGVVLQKKAADTLPQITLGKDTPKILWKFVTNLKWISGLVISGIGWGLFAYALNSTPISLARSIQGSGFVILAFFSVFFLDHNLKTWEWMGVAIVTAGIIFLGMSEPPTQQTVSTIYPLRLVIAVAIGCAVCFTSFGVRKIFNKGFSWLVVFAIFAGVFLGTGDVFTKAVLVEADKKSYFAAFCVIGPALVVFYLTGNFLLSRAYQHGRAILVTAASDFCSRLVTIFYGVFALGEFFPHQAYYRNLRIAGRAAILFGTMLLARFSGEQLAEELSEALTSENEPAIAKSDE
jgi:drug/metabolite transporter (DMT)-like permease